MVFIDVSFHDFTVEGQRVFLGDLVGQLALLGLDNIGVGYADYVGDPVVLLVCLVFGLLGQETFVCESCVDLLPEASGWRLMLRRVLIEFAHLLVKLIHLLIADLLAVHVGLAGSWHWAVRLSRRVARFQVVDLLLNICALLFKPLVLEQLVANLDAKLVVQSKVNWVFHALTKIWLAS